MGTTATQACHNIVQLAISFPVHYTIQLIFLPGHVTQNVSQYIGEPSLLEAGNFVLAMARSLWLDHQVDIVFYKPTNYMIPYDGHT